MIFETIQTDMCRMRDDTNNINKNILYLCRHSVCSENRLENIEKILDQHNIDLRIYQRKVNRLEGKLLGFSAFIAIGVSLLIQIVM